MWKDNYYFVSRIKVNKVKFQQQQEKINKSHAIFF